MSSLVEMKDISKRFGGLQALENVSITVEESEIVALVGDNGAGKSTLIKVLAGVIRQDEGEIYIRGERVSINNADEAKKQGIETVFQELALTENLDAVSNIFLGRELTTFKPFGSKFLGVLDKQGMSKEAQSVLEEFGLEVGSVNTKIRDYSGGERQAVAIARATYTSPELVIMDEPTAALAVEESHKVLELIKKLRDQGIAIIFITHTLEEAFQVADRIVVLRSGRKVGTREPEKSDKEEIVSLMVG